MSAPAVGEAATRLYGLLPAPASLLALARPVVASAWPQLRNDPAALLLLFRHAPTLLTPGLPPPLPALLRNAEVLEEAARHADAAAALDWNHPTIGRVLAASRAYAELAGRLAAQTGRIDPDLAWVGGLLAPLGWLAVCAADVSAATACLADPSLAEHSSETQVRRWGLDQAGIARRLARRWRLPLWLTATAGHLGLAVDLAQTLGADPDLFAVVQFAVGIVERDGRGLGLPVAAGWFEHARSLSLSLNDFRLPEPAADTGANVPPHADACLIRELLLTAAQHRRLADAPALERLERDVDHLHRALETQRAGESGRLQAMILETMAEFAAGAGHEINNPLAVISGQAQYLLTHEAEPSRQRALQTIIGQTQRIHDILTELMHFARPGKPQKRAIEVGSLIREVSVSLGGLAEQRHVRLLCPEAEPALAVSADPRQAQTALACLLRNAIEAAPAEGWAGIRIEAAAPDRLDLVVEDSGPGPTPAQRQHMFDPFYSGRPAGRGRGLGLPTAWRLARENGGDVRFDDLGGSPARFILSLPRAVLDTGPHLPLNGAAVNGQVDHAVVPG